MGFSNEQMDKAVFVYEELADVLRVATRGRVTQAAYWAVGDDEFVTVYTDGGRPFDVNVSCDSLWAIAQDVMRDVGDRLM